MNYIELMQATGDTEAAERVRLFRFARACVKANPKRYKIRYGSDWHPSAFVWVLYEREGKRWSAIQACKPWKPKE